MNEQLDIAFKAGDKVYCPKIGGSIYTLTNYDRKFLAIYFIPTANNCYLFSKHGYDCSSYNRDYISIFHVTQENYELLSKLQPNTVFELPEE